MSAELTQEAIQQVFETLGIASEKQRERLAPLPAALEMVDDDRTNVEIFVAHTTEPVQRVEPSDA